MEPNEVLKPISYGEIREIIAQIKDQSEVTRRAMQKRRHDIYKDDGKKFLLEQIEREFGKASEAEMRLAPVNILKKIVNKKSSIYKQPPTRKCVLDSDQVLVDYYVEELEFNQQMQKWNRYYNLFSNAVAYAVPSGSEIKLRIIPPYLYSIIPNGFDPCKIEGYIFSAFTEYGSVTPSNDQAPATGKESYSRESSIATGEEIIDSQKRTGILQERNYIFWIGNEHFTTDENGQKLFLNPENTDPSQFENPIGELPVINLAKDRDYESWATQGSDLIDLCVAFQLGWSDLLTVAKHQGFSILTMSGFEEPKKLTIGINRILWQKLNAEGGAQPSAQFIQPGSPLEQYNSILMDLLGLILTSNDMNPGTISGNSNASENITSGFARLIQMSDAIEAVEQDKPIMRDAEKSLWEVIAKWHNFMLDQGVLEPEAAALGKFSEDFQIAIQYQDLKPIESETDRLNAVKQLNDLGLVTRADMLKKLYPDMSDEEIQGKLEQIDKEKQSNVDKFLAPPKNVPNQVVDAENMPMLDNVDNGEQIS